MEITFETAEKLGLKKEEFEKIVERQMKEMEAMRGGNGASSEGGNVRVKVIRE